MEHQSFAWVRKGNLEAADALLRGADYAAQKKNYAEGTQVSNNTIAHRIRDNQTKFSQSLLFSTVLSGVSLGILVPTWGWILQLLKRYLADVQSARRSLQCLNDELESSSVRLKCPGD